MTFHPYIPDSTNDQVTSMWIIFMERKQLEYEYWFCCTKGKSKIKDMKESHYLERLKVLFLTYNLTLSIVFAL